jgi:hypothetical protein
MPGRTGKCRRRLPVTSSISQIAVRVRERNHSAWVELGVVGSYPDRVGSDDLATLSPVFVAVALDASRSVTAQYRGCLLPEERDLFVRSRCRSGMRGVALVAVVVALVTAEAADAKFDVSLQVVPHTPRVGEPVRVVIRAPEARGANCRMRLVAVAPGVNRYHALDAFINGGYGVMGPTGQSFHRLRATPRLGFLRAHAKVESNHVARDGPVPTQRQLAADRPERVRGRLHRSAAGGSRRFGSLAASASRQVCSWLRSRWRCSVAAGNGFE